MRTCTLLGLLLAAAALHTPGVDAGPAAGSIDGDRLFERMLAVAETPAGLEIVLNRQTSAPEDACAVLEQDPARNRGRVVVSERLSGILGGDENAWASVFAHEIAHVVLLHVNPGDAAAGATLEREADRYGMLYLVRAGFPLAAFRATWELVGRRLGWERDAKRRHDYQQRLEAMRAAERELRYLPEKFHLARALLASGQFQAALSLLEGLAERFPQSPSVLNNLVVGLLGQYMSGHYPQELAPKPGEPAGVNRHLAPALLWGLPVMVRFEAESLMGLGFSGSTVPPELERARKLVARVQELQPDEPFARINRLTVETFIVRHDASNKAAAAEAAARLEPLLAGSGIDPATHALARNNLGLFHYEVNADPARAVALLDQAMTEGGTPFARYNKGLIGAFDVMAKIPRPEAERLLAGFVDEFGGSATMGAVAAAVAGKEPAQAPETPPSPVIEKLVKEFRDGLAGAKGENGAVLAFAPGAEPEVTDVYTIGRLANGAAVLTYSRNGQTVGLAQVDRETFKRLLRKAGCIDLTDSGCSLPENMRRQLVLERELVERAGREPFPAPSGLPSPYPQYSDPFSECWDNGRMCIRIGSGAGPEGAGVGFGIEFRIGD